MLPELIQLRDLSERHLQLVRELIAELVGARPAITSMDVDGIYGHVARQTNLCRCLEDVRRAESSAWRQATTALSLPSDPHQAIAAIERCEEELAGRLRRIQTALALAEGELRQQNRVHALLIDGTRRTLTILANALASLSPTYSVSSPAPSQPPARVQP